MTKKYFENRLFLFNYRFICIIHFFFYKMKFVFDMITYRIFFYYNKKINTIYYKIERQDIIMY